MEENAIAVAEKESMVIKNSSMQRTAYLVKLAQDLLVNNEASKQQGIMILKTIKLEWKNLNEMRIAKVKPIQVAEKGIQEMFQPSLKRYKEIEAMIKLAIANYDDEVERKREEEQEKIRLRIQAAENKRKAQLAEQAKRAEAKGNTEKSESLKEQAETFHKPVPIIPVAEKTKGQSYRSVYKAKPANGENYYNLLLVPVDYHIVDDAMLNRMASTAFKSGKKIPGVEFYEEKIMSMRN